MSSHAEGNATQAFGASCTASTWDPIADVNKDRIVNMNDVSLFASNQNDEIWCYARMNDNFDSVISHMVFGLTSDKE
jgi:hypothetical protein